MSRVKNVKFEIVNDTHIVTFMFDGHPAWASTLQNQLLIQEGYIFLHPDDNSPDDFWEKKLPPVTLPADNEYGWLPETLSGATTDPEVAALVQMYAGAVMDGTFTEGPIDWRWPPQAANR